MIGKIILLSLFVAIAVSAHAQTLQSKIQVDFEGNKIFSSDALLQKLSPCVAKHSDSESKYDANLYKYCLQTTVLDFLRSKGYLKAKIDESKVQESEQNLKVKISVEEGISYRVGNINIQGAKVFTPEQLLEKLNLKTGDIADGHELRIWLFERLRKLYANEGYIESSFDLEPKFKTFAKKESEGLVDFEIAVDEGRRFTIARIEFAGNKRTSDQVLRSTVLIKEDEPFNHQRFEEGIEKLNGLGLFERIDKDKDVQFRSDTESSLLKLIIQVKEKLP